MSSRGWLPCGGAADTSATWRCAMRRAHQLHAFGSMRSKRLPYKSSNTATVPYGSSVRARTKVTPRRGPA